MLSVRAVRLAFLDVILIIRLRHENWGCNITGTVPRPHLDCFWSCIWPRPCIRPEQTRCSRSHRAADISSCRKGRTAGGPLPRDCDHEHRLCGWEAYSYRHSRRERLGVLSQPGEGSLCRCYRCNPDIGQVPRGWTIRNNPTGWNWFRLHPLPQKTRTES